LPEECVSANAPWPWPRQPVYKKQAHGQVFWLKI
jgi:hypothetical protein